MINDLIFKFKIFLILGLLLFPSFNNAKEILIYADNISYDEDKNIIARGNAKIFQNNEFIFSDLIIFYKDEDKIVLPTEFILKDSDNNYFSGENGSFSKNLNYGKFNNVKIKLNDGSRIIGDSIKRDNDIDIITKAVYSPCKSRIKIGNFICPTWQLEAEKILHDNENLFLYQKHSKMRLINTPIFYIPYIVTPSPLRKERKSGFLSPTISLNFFDTKTSQSTGFPYYFNISKDKELTFTPIVNYGAGVDSSQRFIFDYNQIISGGNLSMDLTFDSNFENQNNNKWLSDANLITNYKKNINENYKISIDSALQTSMNYIQITNPNNDLSYKNSLSTEINLQGYNLRKFDDYLQISSNFYQINQKNEDNKTTPYVLPSVKYYGGSNNFDEIYIDNTFEFYNIFRDKNTKIHSKNQQKISYKLHTNKDIFLKNSKIIIESEIYSQIFNTNKKLIESDKYHSGSYMRIFPILSANIETPFKIKNNGYDFTYNPNLQVVISPGISNSNKISNEDSGVNTYSQETSKLLNRYTGSDKMDNSKRINYGITVKNNIIKMNLNQSYEFTNNSNFHKEQGNDDNLSDLLGSFEYYNEDKIFNYNFRYDHNDRFVKQQNISLKSSFQLGNIKIAYLDEKSKVNNLINQDTETFNYEFESKKINNFSKVTLGGLYDLKKEINTEYTLGYSYFDECFGISLDFNRKSYKEDNLKPQDVLSLMFSFKSIGSYKSTLSGKNDKRDIEWENINLNDELFLSNE